MRSIPTATTRAVLAVVLLGTVLAQVLVPQLAAELGGGYEEVAHLVVPYSAAAVVALGCIQMALVVVWRLLVLVSHDKLSAPRSLRWMDAVAGLVAVGTLVAAAPMIHLLGVVGVGGPGVVFALWACVACGVALVLLVVVARGVLGRAIAHPVG